MKVHVPYMSDADREEMARERRLADAIKEIEQLHALQVGALMTWLRHRGHEKTGVAQRALEQLGDARRQENLIMKNVLGIIDADRRAISKG
jgi:hypothetical protein